MLIGDDTRGDGAHVGGKAKDMLGSIGGVVASLTSLVARLQHVERKQFRPRLEADAAVATALKASLVAE